MDSVFYPEHQQVSRNMWTEGDRYSQYNHGPRGYIHGPSRIRSYGPSRIHS